MASICASQWSIDDVICTSRGSKVAKLSDNGKLCVYTPSSCLRVPFEAGTFDKDPCAQRLNLIIECDDELQEDIYKFDAWIVQYICEHSERLLKRKMSLEQVTAGCCSCLKSAPAGKNFNPTLKTKINLNGYSAIRCWNVDGQAASLPYTWRGLNIRPRLHFSHLWIMGQQFGVVLKSLDAELVESNQPGGNEFRICPFR
jgi:hypothetical protein